MSVTRPSVWEDVVAECSPNLALACRLDVNWNGEGTPPELDSELVSATAEGYRELVERLTR